MFSRRTWARIVFCADILLFPFHVYQWRRAAERADRSVLFVPEWLIVGVGLQVAHSWAYDHDFGAIRTKRWRRILFALFWSGLHRRVFPPSEAIQQNISTGESVGRIGYRLWFGVLRPVPDADE